jgi:hypothetical protein
MSAWAEKERPGRDGGTGSSHCRARGVHAPHRRHRSWPTRRNAPSPTGTRLAFVRDGQIWKATIDGSLPSQVSLGPDDAHPAKPEVHAGFHDRMAGSRNCARGHCTIAGWETRIVEKLPEPGR